MSAKDEEELFKILEEEENEDNTKYNKKEMIKGILNLIIGLLLIIIPIIFIVKNFIG